jgi:UDP-2,4-diacetamido-2,4,6-trideoxy-beta-L-altropyranose hydrolase
MSTQVLLIRADANSQIGTGHVMRCLSLAQAWRDSGGDVIFALASGVEELEDRLRFEGMGVVRVSGKPGGREDGAQTVELCKNYGADWLILDGFHFSQAYREKVRNDRSRLLLLDDHGKCAPYDCDIVLNTNPYASNSMYPQRSEQIRFLLGPRYALLRREFLQFARHCSDVPAMARRVLVTFGGADPHNVTLQVLGALQEIRDVNLDITVIVGANNPHGALLQACVNSSSHTAKVLANVENMAEVIAQAELAVSAGGGTCYELAFMGVPMLLIAIARNHEPTVEAYGEAKAALAAGWFEALARIPIAALLRGLIYNQQLRKELVDNARCLVDGKGAQRVVNVMYAMRRQEGRKS